MHLFVRKSQTCILVVVVGGHCCNLQPWAEPSTQSFRFKTWAPFTASGKCFFVLLLLLSFGLWKVWLIQIHFSGQAKANLNNNNKKPPQKTEVHHFKDHTASGLYWVNM